MRVVLDLGDEIVRDVLEISDDGSSFEDVIESLLMDAIQGRRLTEMTLAEVTDIVQVMLAFALQEAKPVSPFKANELYIKATGNKWSRLNPSTRKSIGRRFRMAIEEHAEESSDGDCIVEFTEKNINNAALYRVTIKGDDFVFDL